MQQRIFLFYAVSYNRPVHGIHLRAGGIGVCLDLQIHIDSQPGPGRIYDGGCLHLPFDDAGFRAQFFCFFSHHHGLFGPTGPGGRTAGAPALDRGADHIHYHGDPGIDLHPAGCGYHAVG